jgi:hypothetical protein
VKAICVEAIHANRPIPTGGQVIQTIKQIEATCDAGLPFDGDPHEETRAPELTLERMYYPYGFPLKVITNSEEVLEIIAGMWGDFEQLTDTEPIISEVHVVEGSSMECPPAPVYRIMLPLMLGVADADNYSIVDLLRNKAQMSISRGALQHRLYVGYLLLGMPGCIISTRYAIGIHAGCVAMDGRGILLCGDSGMGKSTLSYACAKAGWTYVSDDGTYWLSNRNGRLATGDFHRVRFRPTAGELFPEIRGLDITPRAAGKASIELRTGPMNHISCAQTTNVDFMVFLNRKSGESPKLTPYRKDVARQSMRQMMFGVPEILAMQYAKVDRFLEEIDVFELHYTDLDWAIARLEKLVREGQ